MAGSSIVSRLTTEGASWDYHIQLNDFAAELGWRPSDRLSLPFCQDFSSGHLIVEHGLEYTAVISFLTRPYTFDLLSPTQQRSLVSASYNNLIDWSINVDYEGVSFVYNRFRRPDFHVVRQGLQGSNSDVLRSSYFRKISSSKPSPNIPALDRAVVDTISMWKRDLGGRLPGIDNTHLSALFNAILLVRAAEDNKRYADQTLYPALMPNVARSLLEAGQFTFQRIIEVSLDQLSLTNLPSGLLDFVRLDYFDKLDPDVVQELVSDFYQNRFSRYYDYDFSLMSKHALSRIYEHYVSVLRVGTKDQSSLFPEPAIEVNERSYGNIYTPEFIARFFGRYLRKLLPMRAFEQLVVSDPTCGSGIFLRAFLELQNETALGSRTSDAIRNTFDRVSGCDIDENACHAAKLSLSLLSMSLIGEFPPNLKIVSADILDYYLHNSELENSCDVVVANPPYVKIEAQSKLQRDQAAAILGSDFSGRPDLYLAVLKLSLEMLRPGGFGLFVLPETFLKADYARKLRATLSESAIIHAVVDLTAVEVFQDVGVYSMLLIFEKKARLRGLVESAKVVQCRGSVPDALQDLLDDRLVESPNYNIYEVEQRAFGEEWLLEPPLVSRLVRKLDQFPAIEAQCSLRQGMNTGADDVFVIDIERLEELDQDCFAPLLTDREMGRYAVPSTSEKFVFYPYVRGKLITEGDLQESFPATWAYLDEHRSALSKRRSVRNGTVQWWRPERPRKPEEMFRPKIVTPHVVIAARFAADLRGDYAVSRSPLIFSKLDGILVADHLLYLTAVLNSSLVFWDIARRSHVYSGGYSRLEKTTLRNIKIPDFRSVDQRLARAIVRASKERLSSRGDAALAIEERLDMLIADLYRLNTDDLELIGFSNSI